MKIGEIVEIGERVIETPKTAPRQPAAKPKPVPAKQPA